MTMITRNNAEALIPEVVLPEIIQGVVRESKAMQMFRRLPNGTTGRTDMRVLDSLPFAYWQNADTATKKLTQMAWDRKTIYYEEIAVIVPIAEQTLDDAGYDIWGEVKPRLIEAFAKKFDEAVFTGADKPARFRADLLTSIRNAGATVTQGNKTLYEVINDAMVKVEESGYNVSGVVGGVGLKGKFRMMLDQIGRPITGTEIDQLTKAYVDNGAWDNSKAQLIVGDMSQAVYSIRQDITFKILDQAVIQDPSTKEIVYNLAQQDMLALRAVMRIGWEIPNPINALEPDGSVRFPFALVEPSAGAPTTYQVTFTVKDEGEENVEGAKVTFGGQEKLTNSSGVATFNSPANTNYIYSVKKAGYETRYGEANVVAQALAVDVDGFAESTIAKK